MPKMLLRIHAMKLEKILKYESECSKLQDHTMHEAYYRGNHISFQVTTKKGLSG